ncbi:MAG TPA: RNA polymerase sigma-70 factor [Puia sp.]|nr:RNA polymerase sigma-70 factor [Puia sp.]
MMQRESIHADSLLLRQIASGNEKAFKTLFENYNVRLFNYVLGFVKSPQVAEELVMDVFMKLWLGRDLLTQISNFDGFLFRVAHNKTIDFLRAASRDTRLKELLWDQIQAASDLVADKILIRHEFEGKVREAVELLSPHRKTVYKLATEEDLSHDQIAIQLNISKSTVNNHIVEARRFIRNYLVNKMDVAMLLLLFAQI